MAMKDEEQATSSSQERILQRRGYTILHKVGEGSYAKVYLSEYKDAAGNKWRLACKVVDTRKTPKSFNNKFFPRELEIISTLNFPYIVRIHSILQRKQVYFMFMDYAKNGDLLDFVRKNGAIKEAQARVWFSQILSAIKYLHERGIAHRDLKCENILLTSKYNTKLADFGFARHTTNESGEEILADTFCGSVSYAPPEIVSSEKYDCKSADVWSSGVILFVMLNKSMPFNDENLKQLHKDQLARKWKLRAQVNNLLSESGKDFLNAILEPNPKARPLVSQLLQNPWIWSIANRPFSTASIQDAEVIGPGNIRSTLSFSNV